MKPITLYRYKRVDGGITDSPIKPDCEYIERVRLVADEGKMLTIDGFTLYKCKDVDTAEGWYEVDAPIEQEEDLFV